MNADESRAKIKKLIDTVEAEVAEARRWLEATADESATDAERLRHWGALTDTGRRMARDGEAIEQFAVDQIPGRS